MQVNRRNRQSGGAAIVRRIVAETKTLSCFKESAGHRVVPAGKTLFRRDRSIAKVAGAAAGGR